MVDDAAPACRECGRPVRVGRANLDVFEGMHAVCFHYVFEHHPGGDRDEDCGVPGCPAARVDAHRDRLIATVRELLADWSDGPPANWDNHSLPAYLEATLAWLQDCEGYYASRGISIPYNGWEVVRTAMRAATRYERTRRTVFDELTHSTAEGRTPIAPSLVPRCPVDDSAFAP